MKNKERITETLSGNMNERMGEQIKKMERGETSKVVHGCSYDGSGLNTSEKSKDSHP